MTPIRSGQSVLEAGARTPPARTLMDILHETSALNPDAPALQDADGAISYRRLLRLVGEQSAGLSRRGVRRGDKVGIRLPSGSRELYVSILATLSVGAAYVPVDADDPEERARLVFGEARVVGVIGSGGGFELRDGLDGAILADRALSAQEDPALARSTGILPAVDDDAWVIFTSGSTGVPKGVAVSHRSAAAFVDAEARLFLRSEPIGPGDRVLAGLSVAFDASCEEMWLAWRSGACLVTAPRALVRSGADLGPWLIAHGITVVSTVPTLAALWPEESLELVRLVIFGGEACPPELAARIAALGREVWNTYGPTEATVVACAARLGGTGRCASDSPSTAGTSPSSRPGAPESRRVRRGYDLGRDHEPDPRVARLPRTRARHDGGHGSDQRLLETVLLPTRRNPAGDARQRESGPEHPGTQNRCVGCGMAGPVGGPRPAPRVVRSAGTDP